MNTFPKQEPRRWVTYFISPLVAALIAGLGAYVSVQKEMSAVATSVNRMTATIDKLADKQTTFFENFYFPLAVKVERQDAEIKETRMQLLNLKDDFRSVHPQGNRNSK